MAQSNLSTDPNNNTGVGPSNNQPQKDKDGGLDKGKKKKKEKNPKPMDPNNPTVSSTDGSKTILDAIKQVDGGNVSGFIKKALDAMMMIRNIDGASGIGGGGGLSGLGGGGASGGTTSAAMGRGLLNTSILLQAGQQLGLKTILNALNSIMPSLIPQLDDQDIQTLDAAILALITGTDVGVLSPLAVQASNATAAAIASVQALNANSTPAQLATGIVTVATIGGQSLNLDPNSLAFIILNAAVGQVIRNQVNVNKHVIEIDVYINSNYIQAQLANIPSFTGTENQTIATTQAAIVANQLVPLILNNQLTATNFLAILRGIQQNIQNSGLSNALGSGINLSNILGNITQLISQFSGNIMDSENNHQPRARLQTVTQALQNHSKILALIKKKLDISQIFDGMSGMGGLGGLASGNIGSMIGNLSGMLGSGGGGGGGSSGVAQALQNSNIIASTNSITNMLTSILQSAQNPTQYMTGAALNSLINNGGGMLNQLTQTQVHSILQALPPNLAMSIMGTGLTMFSNLTTQEFNAILATLPLTTVSQLLQSAPTLVNFAGADGGYAEQTSNIAAALAVVISTQIAGSQLIAALPNGTTVTVRVLA